MHKKSFTFYIVHLPVVIGLFLLLALGSGWKFFFGQRSGVGSSAPSGFVLGDDDEEEGDDDNSGSGSSDDDDDDSDEDESDDSDSDDDDEDDDNDSDDNSGSGSGDAGSSDDDEEDIEDENEVEDEDELDDDNQGNDSETTQTIINSDGSTTEIKRKVEADKIKIEAKTFSPFGVLLREEKFESEGDKKSESEIKVYSLNGKRTGEIKLKTEDGKLELKVKGTDQALLGANFDPILNEVSLGDDSDDEQEIKIKIRQNRFELERKGVGVLVNFPIYVDPETGKVYVQTGSGRVELQNMPDEILEKAESDDDFDDVEEVELDEDGDDDNEVKYFVRGVDAQKLLGLFSINLPVESAFSVSGDTVEEVQQSLWARFLDLLSF